MGSEFKRLRRFNGLWTTIRALTFAVSAFMLLEGIFLLLGKMQILQLGLLGAVISLAAAAAVGALAFLMIRKSDLRLAEKIDSEQKMRERVQTMVAYRDDEGAVAQLQRADTEQRLKAVRKVGIKFYGIVLHSVMLAVAFCVFAVGMVLPAKAVAGPTTPSTQPTEADYVASEWQKAALEELIEHVDDSEMVEDVKTTMVTGLTQLRQMLDVPTKVSVVRSTVIKNMNDAYTLVDEANSNDDIHKVLSMMSHKVKAYLCYCLGNLLLEDYDEKMDMAETILKSDSAAAASIAAEITAVLKYSDYDNTDALYAAVEAFGFKMAEAGVASEANDLVGTRNLIGEAIYDLRSNASLALTQQWLNKEEAMYIVKTLSEIFAISDKEMPGDPDQEYPLDTSEPPPEVEGSQGTGEMQYPSDDKVYDYKNHAHVIYHQIMDEYYKAMTNDAMDGKFSDEVEAFLRKYFGNLQTDNDEED